MADNPVPPANAANPEQDEGFTRFSFPQPHHPSTQKSAEASAVAEVPTAPQAPPVSPSATDAPATSPATPPNPPAPTPQEPQTDSTVFLGPTQDGVAVLTMNRPERMNAINSEFISDFCDALDEIAADNTIRAVVLTGAGKAFCAGADLKQQSQKPDDISNLRWIYDAQLDLAKLMLKIYELPKPVIAAVNGAAVGGGLAIALHCDVRLASDEASFGSVFIKVGLSSLDVGTSYLLPKIVGVGHARELMLTGRIINAQEAERINLANRTLPPDQLLDEAITLAKEIAANSEYGVWMTKTGLNATLDAPSHRHALEIENRTQVLGTFTGNMKEAAQAFQQNRPPTWHPF